MEIEIGGKRMTKVCEAVKWIIIDQLGLEWYKDDIMKALLVEDLGADSLDLVEMAMTLEEEFSRGGKPLEISDEDAEKLVSVWRVLEFLYDRGITDRTYTHSPEMESALSKAVQKPAPA